MYTSLNLRLIETPEHGFADIQTGTVHEEDFQSASTTADQTSPSKADESTEISLLESIYTRLVVSSRMWMFYLAGTFICTQSDFSKK